MGAVAPAPRPAERVVRACARLVGAGRHQVQARLASLRRLIDERHDQARAQLRTGPACGPRLVVVIDGARRLRALDGVAEVLRRGPEVGVLALCLDEHATDLPEECNVTVVAEAGSVSRLAVWRKGCDPVTSVIADGMDPEPAARLARALAPVVDLAPRRPAGGELPGTVRLLDLLGHWTTLPPAMWCRPGRPRLAAGRPGL